MPLIVEDGTGREDANAYCDVAFADSYFSLRGITEWANATVAQKESSLVKAADYIDRAFSFRGAPSTASQALSWPRSGLSPEDYYLPTALKKAAAEYALRAISKELFVDPTYDSSGRVVKKETKKLQGMEKSIEYDSYQGGIEVRSYPAADNLLAPFIINGNMKFLTR